MKDPGTPPELVMIRGYIGPADVPGFTRVYLDPVMSAWRDVPDRDVVQRARVKPHAKAPFGEDVVWVTRRTALRIPLERTQGSTGALEALAASPADSVPDGAGPPAERLIYGRGPIAQSQIWPP